MFFVLSGFLITYLLLKEYQKTKTIKIKDFYIRRILRIWPLYYLYIGLVALLALTSISWSSTWLYYLTFFANIPFVLGSALPAMDHLWSISVEEQFYLFWPLLFLFSLKGNFIKIISVIILILAVFRIYIWFTAPFSTVALFSVVNRFDCMLLGSLGAYLFFNQSKIIFFIDHKITQTLAWLIIFSMIINVFWFLNSIIEIFVTGFATLVIIIGQINIKNRIVNLENSAISYLGKLSFGIYVYHPLIILLFSTYLKFDPATIPISEFWYMVFVYIAIIGLTIFIAHISYFHFELRFLKLKKKFSIVKSTNSKSDTK
ncbi:acyltransferase [Chryseobacterium gotjawalense]|uniref:Acyltransferase n=1 Tax=Chryseobacterium gotjawalense TaxID=3042315 RepID=A0ABY8RBV9_9FLAO|nr:acyltransferase [Chryseobacterium sp. wdc7]WHF51445.1 acyltransferase [Chryseobacterium sp. wdc7]